MWNPYVNSTLLMPKKKLLAIALLFNCLMLNAQQYILPVYNVRRDSAVVFGDELPLNYCGNPFALKMNIYKPVGDGNTQRPVIICVHGGAFTSGVDFNEGTMNAMAREFARRGYVAVSINYREGHHLFPYGVGNPQFKDAGAAIAYSLINSGSYNWNVPARLYVADSTEVVRSVYRAQQDVKAAIRKMKQRRAMDSSSTCKVFLAGHSAGGISVLTAALTDQESEKPVVANAVANAANPSWTNRCEFELFGNCITWQFEGPGGRDNQSYITHNPGGFNYEAASCYQRPDLGSVQGTVNISSGYNARIMGVAGLCSAIADTSILNGGFYPPIFMYHQPQDRVVPYNFGYPFSYLNDFFTPGPNNKWPVMYGNGWINNKLNRMAYPGAHVLWTYDNSAIDPLGTTTHDIVPSIGVVTDSIARFFSRVMDTSTLCVSQVLALPFTFTAEKVNGNALLRWQGSSAVQQASLFQVQISADGQNFSTLAAVPYNLNQGSYSFEHRTPVPGINYYRITLVYRDGRIEYTEIRTVNFSKQEHAVQFFPNPVKDELKIILPDALARKTIQLHIVNVSGKNVFRQTSRGNALLEVDCSKLAPGIYFVTIADDSGIPVTKKIVKE